MVETKLIITLHSADVEVNNWQLFDPFFYPSFQFIQYFQLARIFFQVFPNICKNGPENSATNFVKTLLTNKCIVCLYCCGWCNFYSSNTVLWFGYILLIFFTTRTKNGLWLFLSGFRHHSLFYHLNSLSEGLFFFSFIFKVTLSWVLLFYEAYYVDTSIWLVVLCLRFLGLHTVG